MIRDLVLNSPPAPLTTVMAVIVVSVFIIIWGAKILPTKIVNHGANLFTPKETTREKTLGVVHFFPEAIIIFTLIQIWFHIAAVYTLLFINIGTILATTIILTYTKTKNIFKNIHKTTWFLLTISIIIPIIVIYDYAPISWNTTFVLILSYAAYVFIAKTSLNEPSHPVYYNPEPIPTKKHSIHHIIIMFLLLSVSITLVVIGTELFIVYTQLAIIYHNVDKVFYAITLATILTLTKTKMFHRSVISNKKYPELYIHEITYNTAATNMTNTLFVYTLSFTYTIIILTLGIMF